LKDRTTPAHIVLDRLAAGSPSDRLAKAQTMHGRIVNTVYVLRYLHRSRHARGRQARSRPAVERNQVSIQMEVPGRRRILSAAYGWVDEDAGRPRIATL
jgi:hypothetical protein